MDTTLDHLLTSTGKATKTYMTKRLEQGWVKEVQQSRIVIRPDENSYVADLNLLVFTVIEELANDLTEAELMTQYAGLTLADIRACSLFMYLRAVGRL